MELGSTLWPSLSESQVSAFIEQALRPLQQVEELFGKELVWEDRSKNTDEEEGEETEIGPDESASQAGSKKVCVLFYFIIYYCTIDNTILCYTIYHIVLYNILRYTHIVICFRVMTRVA